MKWLILAWALFKLVFDTFSNWKVDNADILFLIFICYWELRHKDLEGREKS